MVARLLEFTTHHYLLVGLLVALLLALIVHELRRSGPSLSHNQLTTLVNAGSGIVLDIRPHKEFCTGHVAGALNIPQEKLAERLTELDKYKDKTIVVVDASGMHSGSACTALQKAGHKVAKLGGGMASWRGDNLPVVK